MQKVKISYATKGPCTYISNLVPKGRKICMSADVNLLDMVFL